jgi:hypothetical protein
LQNPKNRIVSSGGHRERPFCRKAEQREKFEEARLRYEKAMAALREIPEETRGRVRFPQLPCEKKEADEAQRLPAGV